MKQLRHRLGTLVKQPVFIAMTLWGHFIILTGVCAYYYFEHGSNPTVKSFLDTIYWGIATVTTVGYDHGAPVTVGGKIVAICMMIMGSIFLWSYTALLATSLVAPEVSLIEREVREMEEDVREFGQEVRRQVMVDEKLILNLKEQVEALTVELIRRDENESSNL